jgi:pimeloyl-ACP methyl ester carboxylesterase
MVSGHNNRMLHTGSGCRVKSAICGVSGKERRMPESDAAVVLAHGAWADGSSWGKVIAGLRSEGVKAVAAPLPLTSLADDVAALDQMPERVDGPVVVAGHAYAGAVIASTGEEKVASLVYVAALAPDEGEAVSDVFYRAEPHPRAPVLAPDRHGLIWLPEEAFARAFAQHASTMEQALLAATQRPLRPPPSASRCGVRPGRTGQAGSW